MIKIDVKYYDEEQETAFSQWPLKNRIDSLVEKGVEVDELEYLIYSVFTEQRDRDGWKTYADMRNLVSHRAETFRQYFDLTQGGLSSRFPSDDGDVAMTEKAGVATSLVVANKIFDLHEADWTRIPKGQVKTLDFSYASTGKAYVEVESKGSVVADVSAKVSSISHHKKSILNKKSEQRQRGHLGHPVFMMGTIASIPNGSHQQAVCWLVDPPGEGVEMDPWKFKLITRLEYYLRGLRPLSQASLLIALRNRIEAIFSVAGYEALDRVRLVGSTGRPFRFRGPFYRNKTIVESMQSRAVGRVFYVGGREFMFMGFDVDVYSLVARQRFQEIVDYESKMAAHESNVQSVEAWLEPQDFRDANPESFGAEWEEKRKRYRLRLIGPVIFTRSGRVAGVLNPAADRRMPIEPKLLKAGGGTLKGKQLNREDLLEKA
ncbi:hypothetical protein HMI51_39290 [Corallococcus coralloides]|nr:hypothetical protein [Corallococcus coralloides]